MIKLLLQSDVFIKAEKQADPNAQLLLENCRAEFSVQAWTPANTVEILAKEGIAADRIQSVLAGISQIPVNALLNERALKTGKEYELGLLIAAANTFKIPTIVADLYAGKNSTPEVIDIAAALGLEDGFQSDKVNFLDLNLALHPIFNQVDGWYTDIIQNTAFAGGQHVVEFEKEFSAFCDCKYTIGLANGTDALRFALIAMGIGPGDEVITVPNTFIATTEVVSQVGATPVFVDVQETSYNIDPDLIAAKITAKTKLILPVHLYGQVADMDRIMEIAEKHNLLVLEDSCQAHGARYKGKRAGTFGHAAAFSMYPGKNLGAYGEAGCVVTNDPKIADTVNCLREHGQSKKYYHRMEGYNGRMDNLQAAALRGKLPFLDEWNQRRQEIAKWYLERWSGVEEVTCPAVADFAAHVFHLFVVLVPDAQGLSTYLNEKGVSTGFHYPLPLHQQEAYQNRIQSQGQFPVTERCAEHLLSLPIFPELTKKQVTKVCDEIISFFAKS